ncbi:MAG TPA: transporter substrate-binding domain-containing protein [Bacilli bacterium]|nr:transporter substrate-binding domain-containing protein [Bacilli bacterium]
MKRFQKTTILGVAALGMLLTSCGSKNYDNSRLVVGLECNYAPFNWTALSTSDYTLPIDGLDGQYADGYDIQVARYLSATLDKEVVIKKFDWEALVPAIQSNQINLIIAGMSYSEERDLSVDFTNPYYQSNIVAIVRKNSPYVDVDTIAGLSGAKVISQLGTIQDQIIDQIPNVIHMTGTDTFSSAALMVNSGDADAMLAEYPVARAIVNANSNLAIVSFTDSFSGIDANDLSVSVAVKEGNQELINLINDALIDLSDTDRQAMMDGAIARSALSE